jgi:hypothetical protein
MKAVTPAEIEQAAAMCATNVRKGVSLSAAVHALSVIRNWDHETCRQIEQQAGAMLKKKRK